MGRDWDEEQPVKDPPPITFSLSWIVFVPDTFTSGASLDENRMGHNPPSDRRKWARLRDWASDRRAVRVHCNLCRRTFHFYAADLAEIYDPNMLAHEWRPDCSKCQRSDYVSVRSFFLGPDDIGRIIMRRPAGHRKIQLWRNEYYGPMQKDRSLILAGDQQIIPPTAEAKPVNTPAGRRQIQGMGVPAAVIRMRFLVTYGAGERSLNPAA